jgi:nucleotide-binding universal stress UspA family protein
MADVVVGVDGSDNSIAALRWAGTYAAFTGSRIRAVTAWEYPSYADTSGMATFPSLALLVESAQATVAEALVEAKIDDDVEVVTDVVEGHPARVLLDRSRDASLLVVGRRGHGGVIGFFTGSVATACANHSAVPVVIVPAPAGT